MEINLDDIEGTTARAITSNIIINILVKGYSIGLEYPTEDIVYITK